VRLIVYRIRLTVIALGCALLGVSLFDWVQAAHSKANGFVWVAAEMPSAPALETAQIWEAPASCTRPYFITALMTAKARLKAHHDRAPEAVRAWQNNPRRDNPRFASADDDQQRRSDADLEYDATLHARYAEWYAAVFRLKTDESQWEQRLDGVADQRVVLTDPPRRNGQDYANGKTNFERSVLYLLGLGGFPADLEYGLRKNCIHITPIKKIAVSVNYLSEMWRWPVDYVAAFSLGFELILVGVLFVPIGLWVLTGNAESARLYVRRKARRLARRIGVLYRQSVPVFWSALRSLRAWARALMRALMTSGLSPSTLDWLRPR
jgi:hypothetical protein